MRTKEGFTARAFLGEIMVLPVGLMTDKHNMIISLSKTGAFVWELLQNDPSYDEILAAVLEKYDVTEETAKADLDQFLEKLRKEDLLYE